jgi:hypothetical protein
MRQKKSILSCVGSFVLVLASVSYAAAAPPDLEVVTDPGSVYYIQKENHFFGLHIDKAIEHARYAEIAGNMGQAAELQEHAKMSLMRAHEAQRAGNVPGLNEGIANLRKALSVRRLTLFVKLVRVCRKRLERSTSQFSQNQWQQLCPLSGESQS